MKEDDVEELDNDSGKIVITGECYQLRQISKSSYFWDLYFKKVNKKGEEKWSVEGYGMTLNACMKRIANYMIAQKLNGKAITMKQYLDIWLKFMESLKKELHGL